MHKFGEIICKYRVLILILAVILLIPSVIGMAKTRINYDILVYLPDDVETIQGENILTEDFEMGNINAVMDGDLDGFINAYLKSESLNKIGSL